MFNVLHLLSFPFFTELTNWQNVDINDNHNDDDNKDIIFII